MTDSGTCKTSLLHRTWGIWKPPEDEHDSGGNHLQGNNEHHMLRLHIAGQEILGSFATREAALTYQADQLTSQLGWPRHPIFSSPCRSPEWDHSEEIELEKEYVFRETCCKQPGALGGLVLTESQLSQYDKSGFLLGLPILESDEMQGILQEFEDLLSWRVARTQDEGEARFRAAHTLWRPLHQELVVRLAKHERVLGVVEDLLGPHYVCWSAHLFCKLPGDPQVQPFHQDAAFWPLSQSRALTVWLAFDDVDESNAAVQFVEGSHRLGCLPWRSTNAAHHFLTQEIPDVDLLGAVVHACLKAGEASVHSDLTIHGSSANESSSRRAGLALRYVATDAKCLGPWINGHKMNVGCILPKGRSSDVTGHWQAVKRRSGKYKAPR